MGSHKNKYSGFIACIGRITIASLIVARDNWNTNDGNPLWYAIIALNVVGLMIGAYIHKKKPFCCAGSVNGRQMTKKEAKNCSRKVYIFETIVA